MLERRPKVAPALSTGIAKSGLSCTTLCAPQPSTGEGAVFGLDGSEKELTRYLFDDALHVAERPPARPGVAVSGVGVEGLGLRVRGLAALLHVCGR